MRRIVFSFSVILIGLLLIVSLETNALAEPGKCYILVEKAGNFDPNLVLASTVSVVSRYIEQVEAPPPGGLRLDDCTYTVNLTEAVSGYFISLSGRKLNSIGNSTRQGMDGFTQALLRAIYRTFESDELKATVCRDYANLLAEDCKPVEAVIFLFNDKGEMMQQGGIVKQNDRFNVMIQPVNTLYAYIVALDSSGNLFKVFPNPDVTFQENPLRAGSQYYFPPKDSDVIFAFDQIPGEEKLYFLLAATPVEELDLFFKNLEGVKSERDRQQAVATFERQFTTRGFKLKQKDQSVILEQTGGSSQLIQQKVMAELLKGSGVLVKTVTLKHLP
jgi:hypothetical protein